MSCAAIFKLVIVGIFVCPGVGYLCGCSERKQGGRLSVIIVVPVQLLIVLVFVLCCDGDAVMYVTECGLHGVHYRL